MMNHDPKFLDDLLDDLENVVNTSTSSYKYVPRPPPEVPVMMNPKIKFAIVPSASAAPVSSTSYKSSENRYGSNQQKSEIDPLDSSIDNLLELLNSPERKLSSSGKQAQPSNTNFQQTYQTYSSSSTPTATPTQVKPSSNSNTPSYSYQSTTQSQTLDTSFDDFLSGLESPKQSSSKSYAQSFSSTGASASSSRPNSTGGSRNSNMSLLSSSGAPTSETGKSRCSRVVLAGSSLSRGLKTSAFSKSACDRLRCLQCNFEVLQFGDRRWDSAVDYMFFRNNVPNVEKLSVNLINSEGNVAYCCQCTWRTIDGETSLSTGTPNQPQWICSGH